MTDEELKQKDFVLLMNRMAIANRAMLISVLQNQIDIIALLEKTDNKVVRDILNKNLAVNYSVCEKEVNDMFKNATDSFFIPIPPHLS